MQSNSIQVVSPRSFVLRTKAGVACPFTAGEVRSIPRFALAEALAQGVRPVDESEIPDEHQDNRPLVVDFQSDLRRSIIYTAVSLIAENNNAFEVHPNAKLALTVIQATSLQELLLAAEELGENPKELKKIGSARDIRAKLMRKFTDMVSE